MPGIFLSPLLVLAGFGLGMIFFGGLWLTLRALPRAKHPVVLTLLSFWLRLILVGTALALLTAGRWQNAVLCVAGFIVSRLLVPRWLKTPVPPGGSFLCI